MVAGQHLQVGPAAQGADLCLFGGFGPDCFAAYEEAAPLAPGWEQRVPLHQIAPLVVHAIKFGGHYREAAARALGMYA